jgi:hypothetical protein
MTISNDAVCCGILVEEFLGECRFKESRFNALVSCILTLLSSECKDEPEDDGDRSEIDGLDPLLEDSFRALFLRSVGRESEFAAARKKLATR